MSLNTIFVATDPSIPNYGDRYRNEEAISPAVAESTVNQIVSKRFVKKQQMWGSSALTDTHMGAR